MAVTTFGIFQSLLTNAVNSDATLDASTKASMLTRINELARADLLLFDVNNVLSVQGNVSKSEATQSIEVAIGAGGTNRVEWAAKQFTVPIDIDGTLGTRGFLPGHVGQSANPAVAMTDVSLFYRTSSNGTWLPFTRSTLLRGVTYIQFAANIADQLAVAALPQVNVPVYQV